MPVDKFGCTYTNASGETQFNPTGLVHRAGDTMRGILSMGGFRLREVGAPVEATDAATMKYVDERLEDTTTKKEVDGIKKEVDGIKKEVDGIKKEATDAATMKYVDERLEATDAATMKYVDERLEDTDAATMKYVDERLEDTTTKKEVDDIKKEVDDIKKEVDGIKKEDKQLLTATTNELKHLVDKVSPDLYELSVNWRLTRTLNIKPIGTPHLTQLKESEPAACVLNLIEPGVYKFLIAGGRRGKNTKECIVSLYTGPPLMRIRQLNLQNGDQFDFSALINTTRKEVAAQLMFSQVPTSVADNLEIATIISIEKLS